MEQWEEGGGGGGSKEFKPGHTLIYLIDLMVKCISVHEAHAKQ